MLFFFQQNITIQCFVEISNFFAELYCDTVKEESKEGIRTFVHFDGTRGNEVTMQSSTLGDSIPG